MMTLSAYARRALLVAALGFYATLSLGAPPASAQAATTGTIADQYADVLRSFNPGLSPANAKDIGEHVLLLASYYSLDPRLLVAIVGVESNWHAGAISPVGAQGWGQLMPATAERLSVQAFEAYENLDGTARYLRRLLKLYANLTPGLRYTLAIAGYNAGPEAVRRYGGIPPYAETRAYVVHVIGLWRRLQESLPGNGKFVPVTVAYTPTKPRIRAPQRVASVADFTRLDTQMLGTRKEFAPPAAPNLMLASREARAMEAEAVLDNPAPRPGVRAVIARRAEPKIAEPKIAEPTRVVSIALSVPSMIPEGEPIPVTLKVRGSGKIRLVEKIGPTIVEQRSVPANVRRVSLRRLPITFRSRVVTIRALALGVRSSDATFVSVPSN